MQILLMIQIELIVTCKFASRDVEPTCALRRFTRLDSLTTCHVLFAIHYMNHTLISIRTHLWC